MRIHRYTALSYIKGGKLRSSRPCSSTPNTRFYFTPLGIFIVGQAIILYIQIRERGWPPFKGEKKMNEITVIAVKSGKILHTTWEDVYLKEGYLFIVDDDDDTLIWVQWIPDAYA